MSLHMMICVQICYESLWYFVHSRFGFWVLLAAKKCVHLYPAVSCWMLFLPLWISLEETTQPRAQDTWAILGHLKHICPAGLCLSSRISIRVYQSQTQMLLSSPLSLKLCLRCRWLKVHLFLRFKPKIGLLRSIWRMSIFVFKLSRGTGIYSGWILPVLFCFLSIGPGSPYIHEMYETCRL